MQKTGVNDMHQVREIESPVGAFSPPSVAAEELTCAAVPQKSFNRILEIHGINIPGNERESIWGEAPKFCPPVTSDADNCPLKNFESVETRLRPPKHIHRKQPDHYGANHAFADYAGKHSERRAEPGA